MADIGLDIGGTNTKGVVLDDAGIVLASDSIPTQPSASGVMASATQLISQLTAQAGLTLADINGVGIGLPGVVDLATGIVANAVNLGITEPFPLASALQNQLDIPVTVDNDLNIAALGAAQLFHDAAGQPRDLAFLSLGTGVAAGYVLGGQVWRGTGVAGEVGHIPIDPNGPVCNCGQRGCLELYCAGSVLERSWPADGDIPAAQALFNAARAGDPKATQVRDGYLGAIAVGVRNLVLSLGPGLVVIGGGVVRLGDQLLTGVQQALAELAAPSPFLQSLNMPERVVLAPADVPVAAIGAAILAHQPSPTSLRA